MKTYAMMVLGCKVNDYEATYVRENMNRYFTEVSFKSKADIYLIFTCCVTNTAEAKTRKFIHDARRENPEGFIAAIGCLSQIKPDSEVFNDVDLVIGSDDKDRIVDLILEGTKMNNVHQKLDADFEELFINSYPERSRSFLKIMDGCNQFCSYCIIPYARGRERSADHDSVIRQARTLAKTNKEIVLTGIHTGRYNDGEYDLLKLLQELCKIEELETIRLSSIEMTEVNDGIIDLIAHSGKLAPHLHIPIQSADDEVLKLMNRPYTVGQYIERIDAIRRMVPDISISTDLIVGFPGENEESFERTLSNLKRIAFSFIHVFPYSRKAGTAADKMDGHIDPATKKQRVKTVMESSRKGYVEFKKRFVSRKLKVLIEKSDEDFSYGYSREYIYVKVPGRFENGRLIDVLIRQAGEEVIGDAVI